MKLDHSIKIETHPGVYAPAEDSLLLLSAINVSKGQRVLEMGCGTGIIALHCAKAGGRVTAVDVSLDAVECAKKNSKLNNIDLEIFQSDLFGSIRGKFDVIIFNPPYLSSHDSEKLAREDVLPLIGGEGGHEVSVRFLEQASEHLNPGGDILLLTSSESQDKVLEAASNRFSVKIVAEERKFFELLAVYNLKIDNP